MFAGLFFMPNEFIQTVKIFDVSLSLLKAVVKFVLLVERKVNPLVTINYVDSSAVFTGL